MYIPSNGLLLVGLARQNMQDSGHSIDFGAVDDTYHFLFKVVLIGDAGVGKTCFVQRFKHGVYIERQGNTLGVDFMLRTVDIDDKKIKVRNLGLNSAYLLVIWAMYDCRNASTSYL